MYRFSHRLAWTAGVVLPVGETLRRWGSWWEFPPAYIDDLLIGAFFLVAAWIAGRRPVVGPKWLGAAYGFACGIGFTSLALTLANLGQPDPTGVSGATAAIVKAVMLACGAAGLAGALAGSEPAVRVDVARIP
jgi:hypothetical protein